MAIDKAIDSGQLDYDLSKIADSIRRKGGTTDNLTFPDGFRTAIDAIQAGGGGFPEYSIYCGDSVYSYGYVLVKDNYDGRFDVIEIYSYDSKSYTAISPIIFASTDSGEAPYDENMVNASVDLYKCHAVDYYGNSVSGAWQGPYTLPIFVYPDEGATEIEIWTMLISLQSEIG